MRTIRSDLAADVPQRRNVLVLTDVLDDSQYL